MMTTPLVTENEAAKILGLSKFTLRNDRHAGVFKIPYVQIGRAVRYKVSDLENFIESHRVTPEN